MLDSDEHNTYPAQWYYKFITNEKYLYHQQIIKGLYLYHKKMRLMAIQLVLSADEHNIYHAQ